MVRAENGENREGRGEEDENWESWQGEELRASRDPGLRAACTREAAGIRVR